MKKALKKPPPQSQKKQPGLEKKMRPLPKSLGVDYLAAGKLRGKVALITGGDSGIGRSVAILFAKEGADVAIVFKSNREKEDALLTASMVEKAGQKALLIQGNLAEQGVCRQCVTQVIKKWRRLDILVNNAAVQYPQKSLEKLSKEQLTETFETNIFSFFYLTQAALKHMKKGAVIINTTSVTAYKGSPQLLDYSSTKGAIVSFTRSLALSLAEKGIRVNGVAPGPIWTPLIPASFSPKRVAKHGEGVPLKRPGQPDEVAPCYVFLASTDSSYMTGQILHPNGGTIVNG